MQCYQAAVDLLLFAMQGLKYVFIEELWATYGFAELLDMISLIKLETDHELFVYTSQIEILKIVLDECIIKETKPWDEYFSDIFQRILGNLIKNDRFDVILFIHRHSVQLRNLFKKSWNSRKLVNNMTGNRTRRELFHALLDEKSLGTWLANTDLLFILLQKKECKFVKKLLKLSPSLLHRFDEEGNNPLIYVCLQVRGCRHCLVEYLIEMGCDLQTRNFKDKNFIDALQLKRNRKLLETLAERETIQIDHISGEITVTLTK